MYIFRVEDKHHNTCPTLFQLQNDPNFIAELLSKIQIKKNMLVKLSVGNYSRHDGLVNGVDGIFQVSFKFPNESVGRCEQMNPHTPKWALTLGVGVPMDF